MLVQKLPCLVLLFFALCSSCKKSTLTPVMDDNGCISRIQRDYSDANKTDLATAQKLLQDNHIATGNIVVSRVILNDTITTNGPVHILQHVIVQQYANGLPILFAQISYHFNNGIFAETTGYLYNNVTLGTTPHTSLPQLRYLFVKASVKDYQALNKNIADSCLVAEFGYYDISPNSHGQLVKAWRVTPPKSDYPVAIIQDDNAKLLLYYNGLLTLNKAGE
ncbi:hypothetical protein [Mucilaginibacter sp. FT3.2]|uniref:hypothetical protein n=1 Tax=Mucilaginibacter sp. FT3.2 TaxID=2723090 RepID=UPI001616C94F|nr:hypothetical protein [Mucilaginibacter sp. FT3.2]MBB6234679.1 hypothetical protein [Mucilaginibacter sp. FT3.2]